MGDSWEHTIRIEKRIPAEAATMYPRLIDGAFIVLLRIAAAFPDSIRSLRPSETSSIPIMTTCSIGTAACSNTTIDADRINKDLGRIAARRTRAATKRVR